MKLDSLINELFGLNDKSTDTKTYNLNTKEGYDEFKTVMNDLKKQTSGKTLFGIDMDDLLNTLDELSTKIYENSKKEEEKKTPKLVVPSEKLNTDQKLKLHKLVQEYIDTMVKPFNNGSLSTEQINNAYAGLYEFAAWVLNK